ncbi:uncharacterized protein MONBRDRAFT_24000 [Monosiga brevicollis MX1]|uniref:Uncharacterized protein n=1 Tax=Monosiga brevicollis TaxID=81824 RepID=A9UUE6_MONBE|nr:uncharacterized protein MONBRDRAFT_24000 [Monosiga brevicollis MX1]EDQ91084.1 predicted protein [Monosiga brevicollis MX1]|eukprot:XP_001744381.1 hypothetical protein [Monosiga brevicollis MX1]
MQRQPRSHASALLLLVVSVQINCLWATGTEPALQRARHRLTAWQECLHQQYTSGKLYPPDSLPQLPANNHEIVACIFPHAAERNFGHVHVFKAGGTSVNQLVRTACACQPGGEYRIFRRLRALNGLPTSELVALERPSAVGRFLSGLAEVLRRGHMPASMIAFAANHTKDETVQHILQSRPTARLLTRWNSHLAPMNAFMFPTRSPNIAPAPVPFLTYITDIQDEAVLQALWHQWTRFAQASNTTCPWPGLTHSRDRANSTYLQQNQDSTRSRHNGGTVDTNTVAHFTIRPSDLTNATIQRIQHVYRVDYACRKT